MHSFIFLLCNILLIPPQTADVHQISLLKGADIIGTVCVTITDDTHTKRYIAMDQLTNVAVTLTTPVRIPVNVNGGVRFVFTHLMTAEVISEGALKMMGYQYTILSIPGGATLLTCEAMTGDLFVRSTAAGRMKFRIQSCDRVMAAVELLVDGEEKEDRGMAVTLARQSEVKAVMEPSNGTVSASVALSSPTPPLSCLLSLFDSSVSSECDVMVLMSDGVSKLPTEYQLTVEAPSGHLIDVRPRDAMSPNGSDLFTFISSEVGSHKVTVMVESRDICQATCTIRPFAPPFRRVLIRESHSESYFRLTVEHAEVGQCGDILIENLYAEIAPNLQLSVASALGAAAVKQWLCFFVLSNIHIQRANF